MTKLLTVVVVVVVVVLVASSASTYAAISDPIETHPLLYFSIKHTPGDFFRTTSFNEQLGTGKHAQIIEVFEPKHNI